MGTVPSLLEGRWYDALVAAGWYPVEFVYQLLTWCESEYPDLALGALVGALALVGVTGSAVDQRRGAYLLVAILIVAPLLKGLGAPEPPLLVHDGRYLFHLLVIFLVVSIVGVLELRRMVRFRWIVPLFLVLTVFRLGLGLYDDATKYAAMVKNINDLQVATAKWLIAETSPDARIATNDIGAIKYLSHRFLIDTEGLITPEAIHPKRMGAAEPRDRRRKAASRRFRGSGLTDRSRSAIVHRRSRRRAYTQQRPPCGNGGAPRRASEEAGRPHPVRDGNLALRSEAPWTGSLHSRVSPRVLRLRPLLPPGRSRRTGACVSGESPRA